MISVRITRQTELQTHPINTLMLSRHASTFSWWKSHLQLMMVWKEETDSTQSGVCSVALSLISASVSHSVALWSFRVVPNMKLLRRYVDTKWWMDKIPRYLVGFDLLTQTETQVHQNITENHLISPDFLKNICYWSNTVIGSLPQQQTSSRTRRDGGILHN